MTSYTILPDNHLFNRTSRAPWRCTRTGFTPVMVLTIWLLTATLLCGPSQAIDTEWGGHLRAIGTVSWLDDNDIYQLSDIDSPFYDGQAEVRLNNQLFFGPRWTLETHYETVLLRGDTIEANNQLARSLAPGSADALIRNTGVNDDRRLMNLTHTIEDGDGHTLYHRLDRLNLTWVAGWGTLRVGRQALTWGNGQVFNPMDLFNPFAPTTVQRDYKSGEDMVHLQRTLGHSEAQLIYVPRRNPDNAEIEEEQASFAGKWHTTLTPLEFDLMVGRHYNDAVFGAGLTGFMGGSAWRLDAIYTRLDDNARRDDYWQAIANIDYAWQWGGKNVYGLLEFYHNGIGRHHNYILALTDADITERIQRGELFTLGENYLAARLQVELHPLVQTSWAAIVNLGDGSGFIQPQLVWDLSTDWQTIFGANLYWGDNDSEYGGYEGSLGITPITIAPATSAYLWLTRYF